MLKDFAVWYKRYLVNCDNKYQTYLNNLEKEIGDVQIEFEKITTMRIQQSNMSLPSDIDGVIDQKSAKLAELEEKIDKAKKIRIEMNDKKTTASKVYSKILKHPKIDKIQIEDSKLHIITKKLSIHHRNIGFFKFTYDTDRNVLFIRNQEYVVDGILDHWHIKYGDPCLHDWKPILWKYLDTFQIFFFVDTVIHYLVLANTNHAYMPFEEWIKKFEAKEKIEKPQAILGELSQNQQDYIHEYNVAHDIYAGQLVGTTIGWESNMSTDSTWSYWSTSTTA